MQKVYFSNKIKKKIEKKRMKKKRESYPKNNKNAYTRAVSFWGVKGSHLCTEKTKKETVNCGKKQKLIMRNDIFFFVLVLFLLSTTWNGVLLNFKRKKEVKSIKICNFLVGHRVWIVCNGCRKTHTHDTHTPKVGNNNN